MIERSYPGATSRCRNISMGPPWRIDPTTAELHLAPRNISMGPPWRIDPTTAELHLAAECAEWRERFGTGVTARRVPDEVVCWRRGQIDASVGGTLCGQVSSLQTNRAVRHGTPIARQHETPIARQHETPIARRLPLPHQHVWQSLKPSVVLKEGNILFNDALNTFYLRLLVYGVRHMVKDHSDSEREREREREREKCFI